MQKKKAKPGNTLQSITLGNTTKLQHFLTSLNIQFTYTSAC